LISLKYNTKELNTLSPWYSIYTSTIMLSVIHFQVNSTHYSKLLHTM